MKVTSHNFLVDYTDNNGRNHVQGFDSWADAFRFGRHMKYRLYDNQVFCYNCDEDYGRYV